ncbi:MAG TPA: helix-turn-helix domain-containing protein [Gemmatimonadaceae bacterium]
MTRLRAAFDSRLLVCASSSMLIDAARTDADLVIVPAVERDGGVLVTAVATISASRRSPPVFAYADRSESEIRALMPLARAGARGVILFGVDDSVAKLRQLLERGSLRWAVANVRLAIERVVSPRHLPLLLLALQHVTDPPTAGDAAQHLGVGRRTLTAWANAAGLRGIRGLMSTCRVLVALEMLRGSDRPVEQVAHDLGFGSSAHLHSTVVRYTRTRPRDAASRDAAFWSQVLLCGQDAPPAGRASGGNTEARRGMAEQA